VRMANPRPRTSAPEHSEHPLPQRRAQPRPARARARARRHRVMVNSTPAARPTRMLPRLNASTGRRKSRMEMSASGILFRLPTRLYTVAVVVLRNLRRGACLSGDQGDGPAGRPRGTCRLGRGGCRRACRCAVQERQLVSMLRVGHAHTVE